MNKFLLENPMRLTFMRKHKGRLPYSVFRPHSTNVYFLKSVFDKRPPTAFFPYPRYCKLPRAIDLECTTLRKWSSCSCPFRSATQPTYTTYLWTHSRTAVLSCWTAAASGTYCGLAMWKRARSRSWINTRRLITSRAAFIYLERTISGTACIGSWIASLVSSTLHPWLMCFPRITSSSNWTGTPKTTVSSTF